MDDVPPPPYSAYDLQTPSNEATPLLSDEPSTRQTEYPIRSTPAIVPSAIIQENEATTALIIDGGYTHSDTAAQQTSFRLNGSPATISATKDPVLVYQITIKSGSSPSSFKFPGPDFTERHVTENDWSTFLNHLFPIHTGECTSGIVTAQSHRSDSSLNDNGFPPDIKAPSSQQEQKTLASEMKLEDRGIRVHKKTPGLSKNIPKELKTSSIQNLSPPISLSLDQEDEKIIEQRAQFYETLQEWNAAFFLPRGLHILATIVPSSKKTLPINMRSSTTGQTLLTSAISAGDMSLVESLLLRGADPNIGSVVSPTPLLTAVNAGNAPLVKLLLQHGALPDNSSMGIHTPLKAACAKSDVEIATILLRFGASPNVKTMGMASALHDAASRSDIPIMKLLLIYGANPNDSMALCETPLAQALTRGDTEVTNLLLAAHADGGKKPWGGPTAIWRAADTGNVTALRQLIAAKGDLNTAPVGIPGPLGQAVEKGHWEAAELLLSGGAKVNSKPWGGKSVLWTAAEKGNVEFVKRLVSRGADLNDSPAGFPTALGSAVERGDYPMIEVLLDSGADTETKPWGYVTPLWRAAEKGDTFSLKLLIAKGAKVDATGSGMPSALSQAVARSDEAVVGVLLANAADIDKDSGRGSPLFQAFSKGNKEILAMFVEKLRRCNATQSKVRLEEMKRIAIERADKGVLRAVDDFSILYG